MAQQIITRYVDDLDGSEAAGPVEFGIDGHTYEIDLNEHNAGRLRDFLAQFTGAGRRIPRRRTTATVTASKPVRADRDQTKAIREWANANGYTVSTRGRIPATVLDAFHAAH